jgi:adenylate cyclase
MLRQIRNISLDVMQEIEAYRSKSGDDSQNLLTKLSADAGEIEHAASVVPVTVMFTDLRDFTGLVEECPPNQVVRQLNEYFSSMTRIIVKHDGILDKYMGDEIMAYFECQNPLEYSQAAYKAVCAGVEMLKTLEELNERWRERGWPELKSGIGINSGPVLKGNIGSMVKMDTTIIGDTVNLASRLQQLNKEYDARLLISASTYKLVQGEFPVRSLGDIAIRGRRKSTVVYEVDLPTIMVADCDDEDDVIINSQQAAS